MIRPLKGAMLATISLVMLAGLSRVPWQPPEADRSVLRLSARFRAEIEQECRRATEEELAAQAAHMRQPTICAPATVAPYRLAVRVDDEEVHSAIVRGSGRPGEGTLYLLEEFAIDAGPRRVQVILRRVGERSTRDPADAVESDESRAARRPARQAVPPLVSLDTSVNVRRGAIVLVTWDAERESFIARGGE